MLALPVARHDLHLAQFLCEVIIGFHRNRQQHWAVVRLDVVPVVPAALLVLHIVEADELVGAGDLGEQTQPWHVPDLMGGKDHSGFLTMTSHTAVS